jgi:tetratricopeptide (TPR) repeat protein/S1-C subfamily serine protease
MSIMFTRSQLLAALVVTLLLSALVTHARAEDTAHETPAVTGDAADENSAPPATVAPKGLSATEVFDRMLPSTCWIRLEWVEGGMTYSSWGTGWVYDIGRRLVVTNEHVIRNHDKATIFFPQEVDGELQHDPQWYLATGEKFTGEVIDRSTARDLALIRLDGLPDNAVALKLAEKSPTSGERIFALGSLPEGSEGLWIMSTGEVRQVYRRSHANQHFARVVETQLPTNRGNSGGAVVNDRLDVVAVVEGHHINARLVSLFIDVNEVREYLGETVPLVEPATAADFETRASRRYDESRYDQAIADYSAALKLDPKLASAMMNRGWAYLQKEDYETAKADFSAALAIDSELLGAYGGRGTAYRELGEYDAAIRDLTEAIRRDATQADMYERRAKCYAAKEEHAKALKDRNRAVELEPEYFDYLVGRAQTYRALKQFDPAQADLQKAISLNPAESTGYYELGWVLYDKEDYQQSRFFFDLAVERDNTNASFVYMRGLATYEMEQYEQALADISWAAQKHPDRPHYHWYVGQCLWMLDRVEEAKQAFTTYIKLKPDSPDGYEMRAEVYDWLEEEELAAADRAKKKKLERGRE